MKKYQQPDIKGYFGIYGGKFVPETLIKPLQELEKVYSKISVDKNFIKELKQLNAEFTGRPTPLTFAERLTAHFNSAKIFLKREDLCHTGAHKINNALGQILLAKKMGKKRIIAETGAGQHGVAVASVCAKFGFECSIYMGAKDMIRQSLNVFRMKMFGAKVVEVNSGSKTLKDATNEALRDWVTNVYGTHYIIGSVAGPHPYPMMVRDFQSIIGTELKSQFHKIFKKNPDYILACVGGGSNAIGIFYPFINDNNTKLIGVEAAGLGLNTDRHSATLTRGSAGVFHGMMSYLLQDQNGQVKETHSISAGLNYPGIGPEHSYLKDKKRVEYFHVTDSEALEGAKILTQLEGILPALETAHAIGHLPRLMKKTKADQTVVVNISGRGDKDISTLIKEFL